MPYPFSLRIPYALELYAVTGNQGSLFLQPKHSFLGAELDCELVVGYEDTTNWEIEALRFEQTRWNPEFEVTAKSDPDLWKLIDRALDLDDKAVCARVIELINEAYYDRQAMREDAMADRYEEYR